MTDKILNIPCRIGLQWFLFLFYYKKQNQGCCVIQAETVEDALQKTIDLRIQPKHDKIEKFVLNEPGIEPNKLYLQKRIKS